jgi:hypothetical protein
MVNDNHGGLAEHWLPFGKTGRSIGGYVGAILDCIRNWHDNLQMAVPGYRDRIAHVKLRKDEGGLNLSMTDDQVTQLSDRGRQAGVMLCQRFGNAGPAQAMNWNNHRWTRFKTSVPLFRNALVRMQTAHASPEPNATYPDYPVLLRRADNDPPTGYWWKLAGNKTTFLNGLDELLNAGAAMTQFPDQPFDVEAPRPQPELRTVPRT